MGMLVEAVWASDIGQLEELLRKGGDPNEKQDEISALIWACDLENYDAVRLLIQYGANVHDCDNDGASALLHAAYAGSARIVTMLLQAGLDVNECDSTKMSPLMAAAKSGSLAVVRRLVSIGADATQRDLLGRTALHWALSEGDYPELISELINAGACRTTRTSDGDTALDYARSLRRLESEAILVSGSVGSS